jgi:TonB family protein
MLELQQKPTARASRSSQGRSAYEDRQHRRLLLALFILVVALGVVVMKDRQFWFGSEAAALEWDGAEYTAAAKTAQPTPAAVNHAKSIPAAKKQLSAVKPAAQPIDAPQPADAPATVTRTVLPPLDVEVVAGDKHHRIHPGSNTTKVELTPPAQSAATFTPATDAAELERMSADVPQPSYPLLAQHMNVQGSVILQAIIGADGVIQDLHVVSGPAILASAAQDAVREWHFKPVLQNGSPVETKARITVNFTIKVADSAGTTLAETHTEGIRILSR